MTIPFPEPTAPVSDRREVLLGYLRYFRDRVLSKTSSLSPADRSARNLPSGWTPLELICHLRFMERRWLQWGFAGEQIDDPWADERDGRWSVGPDVSFEQLAADLTGQARSTQNIVRRHALEDVGAPGPRWDGAAPATLERVLLHVVQEYARHLGQLDVVVELLGGEVGE